MSHALSKPTIGHNIGSFVHREEVRDRQDTLDYDDGLLAVAGPIMMLCYAGVFAITALTFFGSGEALFAVAISIGFALIYFSIPVFMWRVRGARDQRWHKDTVHKASPVVEVWTGPIRRWEAIVQMVSIPIAIVLGFALLSVAWSLTAP